MHKITSCSIKAFLCLLFSIAFPCFGENQKGIGADIAQFGFHLSDHLQEKNENLAFSPYGIFSNLALLYYGSDGETAKQIQSTLDLSSAGDSFLARYKAQLVGLTKPHENGYTFQIANALFPQEGIKIQNKFKGIAQAIFKAKLQTINYAMPDQAVATINDWISAQTLGKIPSIIQKIDIDPSTRLVLANAVYFEGDWTYPFQKAHTRQAPFHPASEDPQEVPTLRQTRRFSYAENERVQCVSLPLSRKETLQPQLECILILPKKDELYSYEKTQSSRQFYQLLDQLKPTLIDLQVPKFCFSKRITLNDPLQAMGMKIPFTNQADFSKIGEVKNLRLTQILHETFFSFNERGITAASATESSIGVTSAPPHHGTIPFHANRPFAFYLIDTHSRAILFMGHVSKLQARSNP